MAIKPESKFIGRVHKHVPDNVYRMKTHNPYVAGVPDCYYSGTKSELWVEYKYIAKLPARGDTLIKLGVTSLQCEWLIGRHDEGRNVAVIVGCSSGGVILRTEDPLGAMQPAAFKLRIISDKEIAAWITAQTT